MVGPEEAAGPMEKAVAVEKVRPEEARGLAKEGATVAALQYMYNNDADKHKAGFTK